MTVANIINDIYWFVKNFDQFYAYLLEIVFVLSSSSSTSS
jgi:hypothetical protein